MNSEPSEQNSYLINHVDLVCQSLYQLTNKYLVDPKLTGVDRARTIFYAPFAVVSHDNSTEPIFNYGNKTALDLFEMTWQEFTAFPSRRSAEPPNQAERARLLATVSSKGFADNYTGVRISKTGKRFVIENVTVWNLVNDLGQAAFYSSWQYLGMKI
jgi:MEKHLA domain